VGDASGKLTSGRPFLTGLRRRLPPQANADVHELHAVQSFDVAQPKPAGVVRRAVELALQTPCHHMRGVDDPEGVEVAIAAVLPRPGRNVEAVDAQQLVQLNRVPALLECLTYRREVRQLRLGDDSGQGRHRRHRVEDIIVSQGRSLHRAGQGGCAEGARPGGRRHSEPKTRGWCRELEVIHLSGEAAEARRTVAGAPQRRLGRRRARQPGLALWEE
jgi:hypothetical protein